MICFSWFKDGLSQSSLGFQNLWFPLLGGLKNGWDDGEESIAVIERKSILLASQYYQGFVSKPSVISGQPNVLALSVNPCSKVCKMISNVTHSTAPLVVKVGNYIGCLPGWLVCYSSDFLANAEDEIIDKKLVFFTLDGASKKCDKVCWTYLTEDTLMIKRFC